MRCYCCDRWLDDFESTRKDSETGEYMDTCNKCLKGLGIATVDRTDLAGTIPLPPEDEPLDPAVEALKQLVNHPPLFEDEEYE